MANRKYNYLPQNGWKLSIDKFPNIEFYAQSVQLPTVTLESADMNFPGKTLYLPGEKVTYGEFDVQFIIDEEMETYAELFEWIKATMKVPEYSDITLIALTGSSNLSMQIRLSDCILTNIGTIAFTSENSTLEYLTCTATFIPNDMNLIRKG
ncbi:hypothetical protein [Synechococcus phage BUCT-ZZ01]|nr:hypothetical protein [Synechococcus phage BUCT-ZZ01]